MLSLAPSSFEQGFQCSSGDPERGLLSYLTKAQADLLQVTLAELLQTLALVPNRERTVHPEGAKGSVKHLPGTLRRMLGTTAMSPSP